MKPFSFSKASANPPLKLDILVMHPSYGGNGGVSSESPDIREWAVETALKAKADPRIGRFDSYTRAETPITMVRNEAVVKARQGGYHLLLQVDSDQNPSMGRGVWPEWKPFWDVAFDELYNHYGKGPLVVGAPYCGPPNGTENVYVFQWDNYGMRGDETLAHLTQYTRAQAELMRGVQEVAALPTGMILYDMRCFDLIEPDPRSQFQILTELSQGKIDVFEANRCLKKGFFDYEWKDQYCAEKASTEDVQNTRDISLAGMQLLGYNPVRCAWDCWIGHHKPWCVGKPLKYGVEQISGTFQRAVERKQNSLERTVDVKQLIAEGIKRGEVLEMAPTNGRH